MARGTASWGWSIALHGVLAGALYLGFTLRPAPDPPPEPAQIEAVVMDQAIIAAADAQRRQTQRQADLERQRREQAEAELRRQQEEEQQRLQQAEDERRAEQQRQLQARQEAERRAKAEADAKRRAEEQARAKAEAERRRAAEDAARKARLEAEEKARLEAELRSRLAAEERRTAAVSGGQRNLYVAAIQAHVERRWFKPPGIRAGMRCTVVVTQIPGGEVVGVRFAVCNASDAVRVSIETAVRNASPLPAPPDPALFEREIHLEFKHEDA